MNNFFVRLIGKSPSSEDPTRNGEIKDQNIIELRQRIQDQIKEGILLQGKEKYNIKIAKREAEHIRDIMSSTYTRYGGILMLEEGESSETIFSGGNGLQALIKRKDICRDMDIMRNDPAGIVVRLRSEKEKELIHERAYRKGYTFSMTITLLLAVLIA